MKHTVISHDHTTGIATIKFEHNDVVFEDTFNLKFVIPGSEGILKEMGIEFTKKHQLTVIDKLVDKITKQIDDGIIVNIPETGLSDYTAPPSFDEEEPTEENTDPEK